MFKIMFSPAGGTRKVLNMLAEKRICTVVDLTDWETDFGRIEIEPDELVLFGIPSYAGRVPVVAAERFKQINGNGANIVLVCVYGNRGYEDTLVEMADLSTAAGFHVVAAVAALAEHAYFPEYAHKRPDKKDRKKFSSIMALIEEKVDSGSDQEISLPGNRPYKPLKKPSFYPEFHIENCTACALCLASCPVRAISEDYKIDEDKCISCTRCVKICPVEARTLPEDQLAALKEKIDAQCQGRKKIELFL